MKGSYGNLSFRINILNLVSSSEKASEIFKEEAGSAPIRQGGKVEISFTPRVFPTPQRESLSHEEDTVSNMPRDAIENSQCNLL